MNREIYSSGSRNWRGVALLLAFALLLGLGFAMSSPAHGAPLAQDAGGRLTGAVTVAGAPAKGITVELRQRANDGADSAVTSTTTGDGGVYTFAGVASAPSDAFYYVRIAGGTGSLSFWYTYPIIYVQGSDFTVPTVEFGDVALLEPAANAQVALPTTLRWNGRGAGETYRIFVYAEGKTDKPVHDSGSLGTAVSYEIAGGALPDGRYEALVQVRDAVSGYGQSQAHFRFSVGAAAAPPPAAEQPAAPQPEATAAATETKRAEESATEGTQPEGPSSGTTEESDGSVETGSEPDAERPADGVTGGDSPDVKVNLTADKAEVQRGGTLLYRIEVQNVGGAAAQGVVVTNMLPTGVTVDSAQARTSSGALAVQGNTVTAQLGDLAPDAKVTLEIPVSVGAEVGPNISTQASAQYTGAANPVQSNAYIAQVAESVSAPSGGGPVAQPKTETQAKPQEQPQSKPQAEKPAQPQSKPAGNPPVKPANSQQNSSPLPQTGGSFPLFLAIVLVTMTLLARYLRGRRAQRV
jgi:uncharacterized repeat protein (TIGR01451 family)